MTQSGIVTFLFTDLIRSTEHLQRVGDEAGQRLFNSRQPIDDAGGHRDRGEELEWLGGGILSAQILTKP
jgi:hypothetical protein